MAKPNKTKIKNLKELDITQTISVTYGGVVDGLLDHKDLTNLEKYLAGMKEMAKTGKDISKPMEELKNNIHKFKEDMIAAGIPVGHLERALERINNTQEEITTWTERQAKLQETIKKTLDSTSKVLDKIVKSNQEIYQTSHKMQLEGNITWRQFRQLYDQAYESARKLNKEVSDHYTKSLFSAKELVGVQEKLITQGFKGLDTTTLTEVSASMALLFRTMGNVDDRLVKAFEGSYKQFGDQTGIFIKDLGDRLNNFSNSFGMTVGMLQGTISEMMSSNTFLARNNMQAQLRANESLMQAAALVSQIGIETTGFVTALARVTQFGTADQMADLFQTGALLEGFSTMGFQQKMQGQDYAGATEDLISAIYRTLSGMPEHDYLRNQYMQMIGSGFGLSQDDLLEIMTHGGDIAEYSLAIQEKLAESQGSMEKELKDFHMSVVDRLENFWESSRTAQYLGKFMNEYGLYGINGMMKLVNIDLGIIIRNQLMQMKAGVGKDIAGKAAGGATKLNAGFDPVTMTGAGAGSKATGGAGTFSNIKPGYVAGGYLGYQASQNLSSSIMRNQNFESESARYGGGALGVLGGAASGALMGFGLGGGPWGAAAGAIIGGGMALSNAFNEGSERKAQDRLIEDQRRIQSRQNQRTASQTQDPVIYRLDKIADTAEKILGTVDDGLTESNRLETYKMQYNIINPEKN